MLPCPRLPSCRSLTRAVPYAAISKSTGAPTPPALVSGRSFMAPVPTMPPRMPSAGGDEDKEHEDEDDWDAPPPPPPPPAGGPSLPSRPGVAGVVPPPPPQDEDEDEEDDAPPPPPPPPPMPSADVGPTAFSLWHTHADAPPSSPSPRSRVSSRTSTCPTMPRPRPSHRARARAPRAMPTRVCGPSRCTTMMPPRTTRLGSRRARRLPRSSRRMRVRSGLVERDIATEKLTHKPMQTGGRA